MKPLNCFAFKSVFARAVASVYLLLASVLALSIEFGQDKAELGFVIYYLYWPASIPVTVISRSVFHQPSFASDAWLVGCFVIVGTAWYFLLAKTLHCIVRFLMKAFN